MPKTRRRETPRSSPVKIIKADGTVEWQSAYNAAELSSVLGQGHRRPKGTPLNLREQAIAHHSMR